MENFEKFCSLAKLTTLPKIDAAVHFIWFHQRVTEAGEIDIKTINLYFVKAHLAEYPHTRLKDALRKNPNITKGATVDKYKLVRKTLERLNEKFIHHFTDQKITIKERAQLSETPFLNQADIDDAHTMAQLYIIVHCYENSVRRFIEKTLSAEIGITW